MEDTVIVRRLLFVFHRDPENILVLRSQTSGFQDRRKWESDVQ